MSLLKTTAAGVVLAGATGLFQGASAHVTLEYQVANAASTYKATLRVGHGCGDSPTRAITVTLPPGVRAAKPMPKPGWTVAVEREPSARPPVGHGNGQPSTEGVRRIRWSANTPADALPGHFYDEFVLQARLPDQAGMLYWPVVQDCAEGRIDWSQVPAAGQPLEGLRHPAAALELLPAAGGGGHAH